MATSIYTNLPSADVNFYSTKERIPFAAYAQVGELDANRTDKALTDATGQLINLDSAYFDSPSSAKIAQDYNKKVESVINAISQGDRSARNLVGELKFENHNITNTLGKAYLERKNEYVSHNSSIKETFKNDPNVRSAIEKEQKVLDLNFNTTNDPSQVIAENGLTKSLELANYHKPIDSREISTDFVNALKGAGITIESVPPEVTSISGLIDYYQAVKSGKIETSSKDKIVNQLSSLFSKDPKYLNSISQNFYSDLINNHQGELTLDDINEYKRISKLQGKEYLDNAINSQGDFSEINKEIKDTQFLQDPGVKIANQAKKKAEDTFGDYFFEVLNLDQKESKVYNDEYISNQMNDNISALNEIISITESLGYTTPEQEAAIKDLKYRINLQDNILESNFNRLISDEKSLLLISKKYLDIIIESTADVYERSELKKLKPEELLKDEGFKERMINFGKDSYKRKSTTDLELFIDRHLTLTPYGKLTEEELNKRKENISGSLKDLAEELSSGKTKTTYKKVLREIPSTVEGNKFSPVTNFQKSIGEDAYTNPGSYLTEHGVTLKNFLQELNNSYDSFNFSIDKDSVRILDDENLGYTANIKVESNGEKMSFSDFITKNKISGLSENMNFYSSGENKHTYLKLGEELYNNGLDMLKLANEKEKNGEKFSGTKETANKLISHGKKMMINATVGEKFSDALYIERNNNWNMKETGLEDAPYSATIPFETKTVSGKEVKFVIEKTKERVGTSKEGKPIMSDKFYISEEKDGELIRKNKESKNSINDLKEWYYDSRLKYISQGK
jgi:hypothetical protein